MRWEIPLDLDLCESLVQVDFQVPGEEAQEINFVQDF